jgi:hypothetical protein
MLNLQKESIESNPVDCHLARRRSAVGDIGKQLYSYMFWVKTSGGTHAVSLPCRTID